MNVQDDLTQLEWRYATKIFDPSQNIDEDVWNSFLKTLLLTPSAFGLQLWQFLDVRDASVRAQLKEVSWDQSQVTDASHYLVLCVRRDVTEEDVMKHLRRVAEVRGLTLESLALYKERAWGAVSAKSDVDRIAWLERQVYIALGFALHAAAMWNLDSCAIEGMDPVRYNEILQLDGTPYRAICGLAVGYRDPSDKYATTPKVRFPQEEVIRVI